MELFYEKSVQVYSSVTLDAISIPLISNFFLIIIVRIDLPDNIKTKENILFLCIPSTYTRILTCVREIRLRNDNVSD